MHGRDKFAAGKINSSDELAMLRLYRECSLEDRQLLLRTGRRLTGKR
jgi:hypothetical protein